MHCSGGRDDRHDRVPARDSRPATPYPGSTDFVCHVHVGGTCRAHAVGHYRAHGVARYSAAGDVNAPVCCTVDQHTRSYGCTYPCPNA